MTPVVRLQVGSESVLSTAQTRRSRPEGVLLLPDRRSVRRAQRLVCGAPSHLPTHLYVLVQLGLVLPGQLLVLPLELGDEDLPLDLLLLLQGQELLLQLLLPQRRLCHGQWELVIQAQVHGHCRGGHLQRQCRGHVHCRESTAQTARHCGAQLAPGALPPCTALLATLES